MLVVHDEGEVRTRVERRGAFCIDYEALRMKDSVNLELLKEARRKSGLPLDFWADLTEGLSQSSLEILVGRSSIFPKYRNSSGKP